MAFDPEWAALRRIRLGGREVLRGICMPVRDRGWSTIPPAVRGLELATTQESFRLSFEVECREREVDFLWKGEVSGAPDGTVRFTMKGLARSTFLSSRISLCVLHPVAECVAQPCRVEHADGTTEEARFPHFISPSQPFLNIRAMSHEVLHGVWAEVRFEGGVFETEDQRNWTDASFKTYSPPLALPRPVEVREGTVIEQSVTLTLKGAVPAEAATPRPTPSEVVLTLDEKPVGCLPRIGLGIASHGRLMSGDAWASLKALSLSHLRLDLTLSDGNYIGRLMAAVAEARRIGASLEIALHLSERAEQELAEFRRFLDKLGDCFDLAMSMLQLEARSMPGLPEELSQFFADTRLPLASWLIFPAAERATTTPELAELARRTLSDVDPAAKIGGGTSRYFTELNRERPPAEALDLVCYSLNPQVHTFDDASLVESLEGQAWTVASAKQFVGSRPLAVTPVTLKPRARPGAAGPDGLPPDADPRQATLFGAAWTLGSLKALAEAGAHSVTYYETTGPLGIMGADSPGRRRSRGAVFPMYHVFADVGESAGAEVVPVACSDPLKACGLCLRRGDESRLLLANFTPEPQRLLIEGLPADLHLRRLNASNVEQATHSPEAFRAAPAEPAAAPRGRLNLTLSPHELVRLDS